MRNDDQIPLSVQQAGRLLSEWRHFKWRGFPAPPFVVRFALRLTGELNVVALKAALDAVVQRHLAFRTEIEGVFDGAPRAAGAEVAAMLEADPAGFALEVARRGLFTELWQPDAFLQTARLECPASLTVIDARYGAPSGSEDDTPRFLDDVLGAPTHTPPHVRAALVRLEKRKCFLSLVANHLAFDGSSADIFIRHVAEAYAAFNKGGDGPRWEVNRGYADFAEKQWARLTGSRLEELISFWEEQRYGVDRLDIADALARSAGRAAESRGGFALAVARVGAESRAELVEFCRENKTTVYMAAMAAVLVVVRAHSGKSRIGIGTYLENRLRAQYREAIGWFATSHGLALTVPGDATVKDLLFEVRRAVYAALGGQELPTQFFKAHLVQRNPKNAPPPLEVLLTSGHSASPKSWSEELTVERVTLPRYRARNPLDVNLTDTNRELRFDARSHVVGEGVLTYFLTNLLTTLEALRQNPNHTVEQLARTLTT